MVIETEFTEAFNDDEYVDNRKNPESLDSKNRILYEIEKLLEIEKEKLKIQHLNKRSRTERRINNKDLYRIYKVIVREMDVKQRIVYNGNHMVDPELLEEADKDVEWFEPDLTPEKDKEK